MTVSRQKHNARFSVRTFLCTAALTAITVTLGGCGMSMKDMTDYITPSFLDRAEDVQFDHDAKYRAAAPVAAWWREFDDPLLAALVEQSLDTNLDIRRAMANLREARAIASRTGFDRFPTVTADASYARQRLSEGGVSGGAVQDRTLDVYETGFDALWELDLFGRVSQRIAAAEALEASAEADLKRIYVSIAAEVARTYIELRGAQYRLDIAERNTENQQETYDLTMKLANGGRATALDTARAQTQLDLTRASIPPLHAEVQAAIHRLSVLTGQVPDALSADLSTRKTLPSLPVSVNIGDVSGLLKRRMDVEVAAQNLRSAVASYNLSTAEIFPEVNLTGAIGYAATDFDQIGTSSALQWAIGPTISWRAFDMGRVRAEIERDDARAMAAVADYEQTVLRALEDVQTSLSDFTREEERRVILRQAAESAAEAARIARVRFDQGADGFLDVLDSERVLLDAEDSLAQSEISAALDMIGIYKALGGGWQVAPVAMAQGDMPKEMQAQTTPAPESELELEPAQAQDVTPDAPIDALTDAQVQEQKEKQADLSQTDGQSE